MSEPSEVYDPKSSIGNVLESVLNTIVSVFEQANVSLPERRYIYAGERGETAHDCEQLTVSFSQVYSGVPGAQEPVVSRCDMPRSVTIYVELVRCIPDKLVGRGQTRRAPSVEDMTMHAKVQGIDAWLLMDAGLIAGEEFLGAVTVAAPGPPSGGYQAVVLELTIGIP